MAATATTPTTGPRARGPLRLTAGRRAALAIGVPLCLLGIASTGLNTVAELGTAKYPVSYTAGRAAKVFDVNVDGGDLTVRPGAVGQPATLAGTATYSLIRSHFGIGTQADGAVKATYQCPMPVGTCELNATVTLPPGLPLNSSSGGGNVTLDGITAPVSLRTGGGDLTVNGTAGRLDLTTGGGDINGAALKSGPVKVSTGGGDVRLVFATDPGNVQVNAGGGNVTIVVPDDSAGYQVSTSTGGGDINNAIGNVSSPRRISVSTGGGDITIERQPAQ